MSFEDELERRFGEYIRENDLDMDPPPLVKDSLPMIVNVIDMLAPVLVAQEGLQSVRYVSACLRAIADSLDHEMTASAPQTSAALLPHAPAHFPGLLHEEWKLH